MDRRLVLEDRTRLVGNHPMAKNPDIPEYSIMIDSLSPRDDEPRSPDQRAKQSPGHLPVSDAPPTSPLQSEELLHTLIQAIPDLVWLKNANGEYLLCNSAFERFSGVPESSIVGRTDHHFLSPALADTFRVHDQAAMAANQPTLNEEWLTFASNGHRGLFQTIKTPLRDAAGGLIGVLGVSREITARQESEARLIASELRYRRLFESAKDGILILDALTGMVMDVNPYLMERLGFSREEFLGKKIWELGFFRDIISNRDNFAELQRNEYIRYEDKPLETANGRRIDVEFVSNVYWVEGQKVIQCNVRDITARKLAERQLREQNEILSNSHEGVMIVNLANEVSLWNEAAAEIFGWTAAEAQGRSFEQLLGLEDLALVTMIGSAVERTGFWNGELSCHARDGRKLTADCRITLVRDETDQPRARLCYLADITEKKALELNFLRMQRLDAIGTLSGGIAHDLNNILSPVLMAGGLLRDRMTDPQDRELMVLIDNSARRGAAVIRQLLTFSRGIEGKRVSLQVRHLVREIAVIVRETFPRDIKLMEDSAKDLWPVEADATQLHQVLLNLCVNARDAMPAGGILKIDATNVQLKKGDPLFGTALHDGPHVMITVSDTGQGIPREIIERVFEPFFTTKALGVGTGLGLSTALGIIRSHGGHIRVYSEPGHGAVFKVYLPADPAVASVAKQGTVPHTEDGHGETILVVDDEPSIVSAVKICLETHGYRVLTADDGPAAIRVFTAHRSEIRVVITDVMMPEMDGLKLARALRQIDGEIRVIASSGLDPAAVPAELAAGFIADFLNKPYDQQMLCAAVHRQVNASAGPSAPSSG
jgi:PAS domain S-box-containing protein